MAGARRSPKREQARVLAASVLEMDTTVPEDFVGGVYANVVKFELGLNDAKLDFFLVSKPPDVSGRAAERGEARLVARVFLPHPILRQLTGIIETHVEAFSRDVFEIPDSSAASKKLIEDEKAQ